MRRKQISPAESRARMKQSLRNFEECIDRFEEAWSEDLPPRILDFLLPDHHDDCQRLVGELIKIDMEYRWRRKHPVVGIRREYAIVEDYAAEHPLIADEGKYSIDLIAEEYRIRRRWGDNPTPLSYFERFPQQASAVDQALQAVDRELSTRQSFVNRPIVPPALTEAFDVPVNRHTLQVGQQIDDFLLLSELGQGAFARVFLAQQISMQRLVALKVSDQSTLESPVLSQLEHPNIVRIFDERRVGSMYLMYMQYVPGGSLREAIDRLKSIPRNEWNGELFLKGVAEKIRAKGEATPREQTDGGLARRDWAATVASLGAQLANALAHAHQLGILHRDIKPENILLSTDGQPMLADFNLSFGSCVQGSAAEKAFGGSLAYMSPEHFQVLLGEATADSVNPSSDVYSLATVLAEALTGYRPFEQTDQRSAPPWTIAEHLAARRRERPLNDRSVPGASFSQPSGIDPFLASCLAFHPTDRPPSAEHVSRRLQLLSLPPLREILTLRAGSWAWRWVEHPIAWYLGLGMIPNALMSPINIWANHRIAIKNFNTEFFHRVEEPVVNLIAFPLGILVAWWLTLPVSKGIETIRQGRKLEVETRAFIARRCLSLPLMIGATVLGLWSGSGIAFPGWNQLATGSQIDAIDFLGFFLSQLLHGMIAACLSMVIVCGIVLRAFFPLVIADEANPSQTQQLAQLAKTLNWANVCLQMTPLFAILALAFSDQFDKPVFVALAIVGFAGHLVASLLIPKLLYRIQWLQRALRPTEALLALRESD